MRIRQGDEWKTAFNTPLGHLKYLLMPFGLTNTPAVLQALINNVLQDFLDRFVFVYLDDIVIISKTLEEHCSHVRAVLQRLMENKLTATVKAVTDWPVPSTQKLLERFLGFANFHRRFIRNYSQVAAPLTHLTSTKLPFIWSNEADSTFTRLKHLFATAPILILPDPDFYCRDGCFCCGVGGSTVPLVSIPVRHLFFASAFASVNEL